MTDLQRVLHLVVAAGGVLVLFQLSLLLLLAFQLIFQAVQLQLGFFQIQLGLTHVIGKQGVARFDLLIYLHQNRVHRGGIILFHLRLILRRDHAGKAIHQTGGTQPADHGHRLHRGLALRVGAAARQRGQQHHGGQRNNSKFFHSVSPCNYFSSKRFLSIYV